ncbi:cadherin-87A-like isoform X3 [Apostichopus japonicus]
MEEENVTFVGYINATDEDGDNITYGIRDTESQYLPLSPSGEPNPYANAKLYLSVDPVTGGVTIISPIDRESTNQLRAVWTASDGQIITVTTPVSLFVFDINDNIPTFPSDLPGRLEPVKENITTNSVVVSFEVLDYDALANGVVDVTLVSSDKDCEMDMFNINKPSPNRNIFEIILKTELDYSISSEYLVCMNASDRGDPMLVSPQIKKVIIPIEDVQNLGPVFLNLPGIIDMEEDTLVGTPILQVTAVDGDRGVPEPNIVTYSMSSDSFTINGDNGNITLSNQVDREQLTENPIRLIVTATEEDNTQPLANRTTETTIIIRVLDVDDEIPNFDKGYVKVKLYENAPVGTALNLGVTVTDDDEVTNNDFELELVQDLDAFKLKGTTSVGGSLPVDVRVKDSVYLDYETRQQLNFTVVVKSNPESKLEVVVDLINENDNTPQFLQDSYEGSFLENATSGYSILSISATDDDVRDNITYKMAPTLNDINIDPSSGVISVSENAVLDAEITESYIFTVEASDDSGAVNLTQVTLSCEDVNDNAPFFLRHLAELSIQEFTLDDMPADPIITFQAFDRDITEPNNVVGYYILSGDDDNKFEMNPENGTLNFIGAVDYDGPDGYKSFNLTIAAEDGGNPSMRGTTNLNVVIEDVNDNSPVFESNNYSFTVQEDAIEGALVGTVTATDLDTERGGDVSYIIVSGGIGSFLIDETGSILVNSELDRETEASYSLTIVASDGLNQGDCTVTITIADVNDELPTFEEEAYEFEVSEDVTGYVGEVTASDEDEDSILKYSISTIEARDENGETVTGGFTSQFNLDEDTGVITVNEPLDREVVETFRMTVSVTDTNATDIQRVEVEVVIEVLDVNDESPVITLPDNATVAENSFVGTVVTTGITAEDKDKGPNGLVRYSLDDDAGGLFSIDEDDGTLIVSGNIDREKNATLKIIVRASDEGSNPQSSTADFWILVRDVNDNPPKFNDTVYFVELEENADNDTVVIVVTATDIDEDHGNIVYTLQGDTEDWFKINDSGVITVANQPDRETYALVVLTVVAQDTGDRHGDTLVNITILDQNDNSPEFTSSFPEPVTVSESTDADVTIVTVVATDPDQGEAGQVTYHLLSYSQSELFGLNATSGEVYTTMSLEKQNGSYLLGIEARDGGVVPPPLGYTIENMTIYIDDASNDRPYITYPESGNKSGISIPEFYNLTEKIFTAEAFDSDADDDGEIAYRFLEIGEDWNKFHVDNITGDVYYIFDPPDWSEFPEFNLYLEAYNYLSEVQYSDTVDFTIKVIDSDNHDPVFWDPSSDEPVTIEPIQMEVIEEIEGPTRIGFVSATDMDDGNIIYYYIVAGNEDDLFEMNKTSGEIYTSEKLDSDLATNVYELIIKATEDANYAGRRKRATLDPQTNPSLVAVIITIVDKNDNPPRFAKDLYTAAVVYTTGIEVFVTQVEADDKDKDPGNTIKRHRIEEQKQLDLSKKVVANSDAFTIMEETGEIFTNTVFLGLENGIYFDLTISVTDPTTNDPEYNDQTELLIYVIAENQQLNVHTLVDAEMTREHSPKLGSEFENIFTEAEGGVYSVDFDRISTYTFETGDVNVNQTEALFHVVNLTDNVNVVVPSKEVLYILDHSPDHIDTVRDKFDVESILLAVASVSQPPLTSFQLALIILSGVFLFILILAIIAFVFFQNQNTKILAAYGLNVADYKTQKDDTAFTNESSDDDPNYEDPPIYPQGKTSYENPSYQPEDGDVDRASEASSQENVMDIDDEDEYEEPPEVARNSKMLDDLLTQQNIGFEPEITDV